MGVRMELVTQELAGRLEGGNMLEILRRMDPAAKRLIRQPIAKG